jgi:hypothetical protein
MSHPARTDMNSISSIGSQDSSHGTAKGLDGRGSILSRGKNFLFSTASIPALGPTQYPIKMGIWGSFAGGEEMSSSLQRPYRF